MNRRELVHSIAAHTGQVAKDVDNTLKGFVDVVLHSVAKGEIVAIPGFAKFAKVQRGARMGRNPATGEPVKIKASTKARITPLKGFKDVVAGNAKPPKVSASAAATKAAAPKKAAATKAAPAKKAATKAAAKKAATKAPAKKATAAKKAAKR